MKESKVWRALKGAVIAVVGAGVLATCLLWVVLTGVAMVDSIWGGGHYGPLWLIPFPTLLYAVAVVGTIMIYAALPIAIIGALVGLFWRRR